MTKTRLFLLIVMALTAWMLFREDSQDPVETEETVVFEEEAIEDISEIESNSPALVPTPKPQIKPKKLVLKQTPTKTSPRAKYPNLDKSFAPFDEQGNRFLEQIQKSGRHLVYDGDVLLGSTKDLAKLMKAGVAKVGKARKWPRGRIPYVIDDSVVQAEKVIEAVEYLNIYTNLKIVPRENEADYVLVTRGDADCYSYAGRVGGKQEIFLVPQCGIREILHEWMHTIGFLHEQNREDRDQHVTINWQNIDEVHHSQFKKMPNDFLGLVGRPFDYQSIMLYHSYVFSLDRHEPALTTSDGDIIEPSQNLLSSEDILRINLAYPEGA